MYRLALPLFGRTAPNMARKADIPIAWTSHFGMLDMAHYFNKNVPKTPPPAMGSSVEEVNCVPHYDPGLLSISFFSDNEGLQLFDPTTQKWVDGPLTSTTAVIWLGEAALKASKKKPLKAGVHRVIYPKNRKPRLTMWYEVCTVKQATEQEKYFSSKMVSIPNLVGGS